MNILFPTDFSKNSKTALKYASDLIKRLNGKITLVNIFEAPTMESVSLGSIGDFSGGGPARRLQEKVIKDKREEAEQNLIELQREAGLSSEQCNIVAITGAIKVELDKMLRNEKYSLIVLGTRGDGTQKGLFFSGIANHLIKTAQCPVLAVPEDASHGIVEQILYPTDLTHDETYNLNWLIGYAKLNNAVVHLLHVKNNKVENGSGLLNAMIEKLPYDKITFEIVESAGDVSNAILEHSNKDSADMIAMTTHTTTLFDKIFHSSISTEILGKVNIPFIGFADKKTEQYNFE